MFSLAEPGKRARAFPSSSWGGDGLFVCTYGFQCGQLEREWCPSPRRETFAHTRSPACPHVSHGTRCQPSPQYARRGTSTTAGYPATRSLRLRQVKSFFICRISRTGGDGGGGGIVRLSSTVTVDGP